MRRDEPLRVSAAEVQRLATADDSSSDDEAAGPVDRGFDLPPGWSKAQRVTASGRKYWRFTGPPDSGSRVMFSLVSAWGEFDSHQEPANEDDSDDGSVLPFANVSNELGRDIDNEGPSDGLGRMRRWRRFRLSRRSWSQWQLLLLVSRKACVRNLWGLHRYSFLSW